MHHLVIISANSFYQHNIICINLLFLLEEMYYIKKVKHLFYSTCYFRLYILLFLPLFLLCYILSILSERIETM